MSSHTIIGLEIHIELRTKSKMFCRCRADYFGQPPNTYVCPVCLGLPGALPVPNQKAIEWTVMMGLALNCQINNLSKFDRKNYFYPDLPKGYQISQYDLPLCQKGNFQRARIRRVHLEEDTGKLFHQKVNNQEVSLIDFNRSGVPLMEIVTEPDLHSAAQAKEFLKKLRQLVRFLGIADADMEKGQMRCEQTVNLEIEEKGKRYYTPLVEIKNINSFRFAEKAINYEVERQLQEFQKTGEVKQLGNKTTSGWNEVKQVTVLQREKEEAADYRYFPEPDIPPLRLTKQQIERLRKRLPTMPGDKMAKLIKEGLTEYQAKNLVKSPPALKFFEEAIKFQAEQGQVDAIGTANLIINKKVDIEKTTPQEIKKILESKKAVPQIGVRDLMAKIELVLKNNPQVVEEFKKGKQTVVEFLIGQVMVQTKGQADPNRVREALREKLKSA